MTCKIGERPFFELFKCTTSKQKKPQHEDFAKAAAAAARVHAKVDLSTLIHAVPTLHPKRGVFSYTEEIFLAKLAALC